MIQISEILTFLKKAGIPFSFSGDEAAGVERFSSLANYKDGSFTWIKGQKNIPEGFDLSRLALVFTAEDVDVGTAPCVIRTAESKRAFFSTIEHFYEEQEERPAIGQFTYISPKVKLGKNVRIGHNCTLDGEIIIGDNTVIGNNVTIVNKVMIGTNCEIQSGSVIGHDGFSFTERAEHKKTMVRHYGGVVLGNDVYIGAATVIERGVVDDTIISNGCKLDCCCLIGHNSVVEEDCALVGQTLLLGSVHMEKNSYVASGIVRNQCSLGENSVVGIGSIVVKDVPANQTVIGNPAKPYIKKD